VSGTERDSPLGRWLMLFALVVLTLITMVQFTYRAMLPPMKTEELILTVIATVFAAVALRSGWARGDDRITEQAAIGTISNSFYDPRRKALTEGGAVLGGVVGGLWWGVSTWVILLTGMRHSDILLGMRGYEVAVLVGVLSGGMIGALAGRLVGNIWENAHRRRRMGKPVRYS